MKTLCNFAAMKAERTISAYKNYFRDFISSLTEAEARKVFYVIDMLKTQERVNAKFVKYLRNVVMLFNGFQKKTQKTPQSEINKAIQIKKEYYAGKK